MDEKFMRNVDEVPMTKLEEIKDDSIGGLTIKMYKEDDNVRLKCALDVSTNSISDLVSAVVAIKEKIDMIERLGRMAEKIRG